MGWHWLHAACCGLALAGTAVALGGLVAVQTHCTNSGGDTLFGYLTRVYLQVAGSAGRPGAPCPPPACLETAQWAPGGREPRSTLRLASRTDAAASAANGYGAGGRRRWPPSWPPPCRLAPMRPLPTHKTSQMDAADGFATTVRAARGSPVMWGHFV